MSAPRRRPLWIVPLGSLGLPDGVLERLGRDLDERFRTHARLADAPFHPQEAAERPGADRLLSDAVLDRLALSAQPGPHGDWILALTEYDLAAPGRDYVFGEATVSGHWALVSLFRLREELRTGEGERLYGRLLKEATHELGHLAGLGHCPDPRCVMHPSTTPADVDPKGDDICHACIQDLDRLALTQ